MNFSVTKRVQMFVKPSESTPSESLKLSVIDQVPGLRHLVRSLHVFEKGEEPARVIREAVGKALVPYYPFAGRFKVEEEGGEVVVECSGEGAWFVEAVASCTLEDVGKLDVPLVISTEALFPGPQPEFDPLDIPVMMQVTEFQCGGFVIGLICVHTLADGIGAAQFITAISDFARGLPAPTVIPTRSHHLIPNPLTPPSPPPLMTGPPLSFQFLPSVFDLALPQIHHLKSLYLAATATHCSTFDATLALAWRARTRAINLPSETLVRVIFFANTRHLLPESTGYYGNCFYPVTVTATSGAIADGEIEEVIRTIREAKGRLGDEFGRWARGELTEDPYDLTFTYETLFVSDLSRLGFWEVDYGWGRPMHVVPFGYVDGMAVAVIGPRPRPMEGVRVMTQCVGREHMGTFQKNMEEKN